MSKEWQKAELKDKRQAQAHPGNKAPEEMADHKDGWAGGVER